VAAQDGSGQRAIAVPTLAFDPVKRALDCIAAVRQDARAGQG